MVEVVIKFDKTKNNYAVYEPTTDSLMVASNLTEALVMLNNFLQTSGMSKVDLLDCPDISYHVDSATMRAIIEGNMKLIKRLNTAPSGFMLSGQKFGSGNNNNNSNQQSNTPSKGKQKTGGGFASATGFRSSYRKFGGSKL